MYCESPGEVGNMATKMKLLKMMQEVKGIAQITNRRPAPRPPLLYLMQLRSQVAPTNTPRRRVVIEAAALTAPLPIKINHIKTDKSAAAVMA
jgi:hypothetical protein